MSAAQYIKPKALAKGDTIGIVAPASSSVPHNVKNAVRALKRMGFKVLTPDSVFAPRRYTLREDREKAEEIHEMFRRPEVKAVFCAKGGYGCIRVLPHLSAKVLRENPKIFMGYSDASFLLNFLVSRCGMVAFHGPMVVGDMSREMPQAKQQTLWNALMRRKPLGKLTHKNLRVLRKGKATGVLLGGCLTSLVRLLGTPEALNTDGAILFLEDISESPVNIEEMLFQLKIAGKFAKIRGLVFGQMRLCGPSEPLMRRIRAALADVRVPMLFGFPSGHSFSNITLPLGVKATLDTALPGLIVREAAVA